MSISGIRWICYWKKVLTACWLRIGWFFWGGGHFKIKSETELSVSVGVPVDEFCSFVYNETESFSIVEIRVFMKFSRVYCLFYWFNCYFILFIYQWLLWEGTERTDGTMYKFLGVSLREVDVMNKDGFTIIYREGKKWTGGIMWRFKGVGLRKVNILINYDLMNKMIPLGRGRRGGVTFKS